MSVLRRLFTLFYWEISTELARDELSFGHDWADRWAGAFLAHPCLAQC
jgi:hypothetical protein